MPWILFKARGKTLQSKIAPAWKLFGCGPPFVDSQAIRRLVRSGKYEFSKHAERERQADQITVAKFEEALTQSEIIEEYPDDPRGPSCLALGFAGRKPIHAVCAVKTDPDEVLIITVYDPSKRPEKWTEDYRGRKE